MINQKAKGVPSIFFGLLFISAPLQFAARLNFIFHARDYLAYGCKFMGQVKQQAYGL
jgi:hypothetical protein